ncbi:MAG: FkbM family methyltransferase [Verrucomicrobiales bacterium]|jgi:FkbM family methyltransferase|nr:FkbM family methyltransferase [Verrucomicrobiales bacterium]
MYRRGNYEPHLTRFVNEHVSLWSEDHAFDVGAHLGWYSLLLNSQGQGNIHSFEPDPMNFSLLSENLEMNHAGRVKTNQAAVGETPGTLTLHLYPDKNRGRHSILPINDGEKVEVEAVSLDDYCRSLEIDPALVRFVKIDVEGFEPIALKGASEILKANPLILSEYAPEYMEKGGISIPDYLEMMFGNGFSAYKIDEEGIEVINRDDLSKVSEAIDVVWSKDPIS